jgi:parallel beta-helix repeat protein
MSKTQIAVTYFLRLLASASAPHLVRLVTDILLRTKALVVLVALLTLGLALSTPAGATTYYVDNTVASSGNGTSWANAWRSFSQIAWAALHPGDTLVISGGASAQTYPETLTVGASGITITASTDPGHNGTVIIDGQGSRANGIILDGVHDVTVQGLTVQNHVEAQIRVDNGSGYRIEANTLYVTGNGGVFVQRCTNTVVRGNTITTPAYSTAQTDGIYSQRNGGGNVYEANTIIISNNEPTGHDDCIQLYQDASTTIRGNYCEQANTKTSNAQGFWLEDNTGTIEVTDNVLYGLNTGNTLIGLGNINSGNAQLVATNNMVVGSAWGSIWIQNAPNSVIKNNTVQSDAANATLIRIKGAMPPAGNVDANLYAASNSSQPFWNESANTYYTWAAWRQLGYDANGQMTHAVNDVPPSNTTYTLTASPDTVAPGQPVTASWTVTSGGTKDWIGLYAVGAPNTNYLAWTYTNAALSGSFTVTPSAPGTYEFRYLVNDGYADVARSETVVIMTPASN